MTFATPFQRGEPIRFEYELAERLGMTHHLLMQSLSEDELMHWRLLQDVRIAEARRANSSFGS